MCCKETQLHWISVAVTDQVISDELKNQCNYKLLPWNMEQAAIIRSTINTAPSNLGAVLNSATYFN